MGLLLHLILLAEKAFIECYIHTWFVIYVILIM